MEQMQRSISTFCALLRPRSDHRLRATGGRRRTARPSCPTPRCLGGNSLSLQRASFSEFMLLGCPISMAMVMVIWQGDKGTTRQRERLPRVFGRERLVQQRDSSMGLPAAGARCLAFVLGLPALHPPPRHRRRRRPRVLCRRRRRLITLRQVARSDFIPPRRPGRHRRSHHCPLLLQASSPLPLFPFLFPFLCLGPGLMYSSRRTPISFFSVLAPSR